MSSAFLLEEAEARTILFIVYNITMISLKVKEAKSLKEKILGLIGKEKAESLLLKTRFGIHTFGLKFLIDVLILDKNYKVKYIKENLLSNRIFFWNPKYNMIVELPNGVVKKNKIKIGQMIELLII